MDGAFDEHLIRDFGALNLALAATLIGAAVIGTTAVARLAALAALLFAVPHFVYHLGHVGHFATVDQVMILSTLALGVVIPLVVLFVPERNQVRSATP